MSGRRGFQASRVSGCAWAAALAATAAAFVAGSTPAVAAPQLSAAYVPKQLLAAATASPTGLFHVIVQGAGDGGSRAVASSVTATATALPRTGAGVERRFATIAGVSADLTGRQILRLATKFGVLAITNDAPLVPTALGPVPIAPPAVAGAATEGATLSASAGAWSGTDPVTFAYQWQRCDPAGAACGDLAGATEAAYAITTADIGSTLRIVVLATDPNGSTSASSDPTAPVAAAVLPPPPPPPPPPLPLAPDPPANATAPVISGEALVGSTLTADPGTWTGTAPLAFAYQWERCAASCVDLPQATLPTYVVGRDDAASTLRVLVSVTGPGGTASAVSATSAPVARWSSLQLWPYAAGLGGIWAGALDPQPPAIAVVDSGVDSSLPDFAGRVVEQVRFGSLTPNSPGDGRGHGTFVAAIAAGSATGHAGAAPHASIVSLDVLNDLGEGRTSDVIAAADWILQNKDLYRIRVANFSLQGTTAGSIRYDPLDKAVENLWLSGVVVVAAAGNYAVDGAVSGIPFAPANDPFVITVGAANVAGTVTTADDVAAPWSAYGHTPDGFAKPELGAPGRYIVAAVPPDATLPLQYPERVVEPGYMQLSGTSFAAPVVSGAALDLLALHPDWTPDQVKGALMLTAQPTAGGTALGIGEVDAAAAAAVTSPPNPNLALDAYVVPDPAGGPVPVFDAEAWGTAAAASSTWAAEAWGTEAWGTASWSAEAWGTGYWESSAFSAEAWGTAANADEAWGTGVVPDGATGDFLPGGYMRDR